MTQRNLRFDITYWAPAARLGDFGEINYSQPVLIKGMWQENAVTVTKTNGDEVTSRAVVAVDRDLVIGGYLAPGDQVSIASPFQADGALEIQAFQSSPDLRNMEQNRRAYL